MMTNHMLAPWTKTQTERGSVVFACDGKPIYTPERTSEQREAMADLIAAAPLMLKALVKAKQVIENAVMAGCDDPDTMEHALAHHPTLIDIRAAIAKATGGDA